MVLSKQFSTSIAQRNFLVSIVCLHYQQNEIIWSYRDIYEPAVGDSWPFICGGSSGGFETGVISNFSKSFSVVAIIKKRIESLITVCIVLVVESLKRMDFFLDLNH